MRSKIKIVDDDEQSSHTQSSTNQGKIVVSIKISDCTSLQGMLNNLNGYYELTNNIDCSQTKTWNNGAGFEPIGASTNTCFKGTLNGNSYTISQLYMYRPTTSMAGLFGCSSGYVFDLGLEQVTIVGYNFAGGLIGLNLEGTVSNTFSTGNVYGGQNAVGGLIGQNNNVVIRSYSQGSVVGANFVGGLVGSNYNSVSNSYSTASAMGTNGNIVGGLIGSNWALLSNSYSIGHINSDGGGLVGFVGPNGGTVLSYWDVQTSGKTFSASGLGKSTTQMKNPSTYENWNFYNIWQMGNGNSYPVFRVVPVTISFKPIPSPQIVNVTFTITLTADSTIFNSELAFYAERGQISPLYSAMQDGIWQNKVKVFSVGKDNKISVRWTIAGFSGTATSNSFTVLDTNNQIPNNATIIGWIKDTNNQPILAAKVQLFADDPVIQLIANQTTQTDKNGFYKFHGLPAEEYYIQTQKLAYQTATTTVQTAENRFVTGNQQLLTSCTNKSLQKSNPKIPVLLVPGIMGSTTKFSSVIYPELPPTTPAWNSGLLRLLDPFKRVGWEKLIKKLKKYGYEDCEIFGIPYDWSLPVTQIRDQYLIPVINAIKKTTSSDKVDIVAHSMGGLVVRSYVQSQQYQGDIRRLALVATPSKGSDNVYYLWEGGDPIASDKNGGVTAPLPGRYFYTNTLNKLYKERRGNQKNVCHYAGLGILKEPNWCNVKSVFKFVHNQVKSAGNLMPTYSDALVDKKDQPKPIVAMENILTNALNQGKCYNPGCIDPNTLTPYNFKLPATVFSSDKSLVQTKLFVGIDESTIQSISVQKPNKKTIFYPDGEPIPLLDPSKPTIGDGTVLIDSADFNNYFPPPNKGLSIDSKKAEHGSAVNTFKQSVVNFLNENSTASSDIVEDKKTNTTLLTFRMNGRVNAVINGPSVISDEEVSIEKSIYYITNPKAGTYRVTLNSPYEENYELSLMYLDETTQIVLASDNIGYSDKTLQSFTLFLNSSSTTMPLTLSRAFGTPTELTMENATDGNVLLTWKDPTNNELHDVFYYQLFSRLNFEPYFQYLTPSAITNYSTDLSWSQAIARSFIVRSILKDGSSTFFSDELWIEDVVNSLNSAMQKEKFNNHSANLPIFLPTSLSTYISPKSSLNAQTSGSIHAHPNIAFSLFAYCILALQHRFNSIVDFMSPTDRTQSFERPSTAIDTTHCQKLKRLQTPFDRAVLHSEPTFHKITLEKIYTVRFFKTGTEVGSAKLYGENRICHSIVDNRRITNIVQLDGVLAQVEPCLDEAFSTVPECATPLPTTNQLILHGFSRSALHGVAGLSYGATTKFIERAAISLGARPVVINIIKLLPIFILLISYLYGGFDANHLVFGISFVTHFLMYSMNFSNSKISTGATYTAAAGASYYTEGCFGLVNWAASQGGLKLGEGAVDLVANKLSPKKNN